MKKYSMQFAIKINRDQTIEIGKSVVLTPKTQYTGKGIKWFDDTKLIRGGGAV